MIASPVVFGILLLSVYKVLDLLCTTIPCLHPVLQGRGQSRGKLPPANPNRKVVVRDQEAMILSTFYYANHLSALNNIWSHLQLQPISQSAFSHLDEVFIAFGNLDMKYTEMMQFAGDEVSCQVIITSIEKQWADASVLLNTLFKTTLFCSHSSFSLININCLMQSLFTHFFLDEAIPWLFNSLMEYIEGNGEFCQMASLINSVESTHKVGDCYRHRYHADIK